MAMPARFGGGRAAHEEQPHSFDQFTTGATLVTSQAAEALPSGLRGIMRSRTAQTGV